jgi:hypothetical protein
VAVVQAIAEGIPRCRLLGNPRFENPETWGTPAHRSTHTCRNRVGQISFLIVQNPRCRLLWKPTFRKSRNVGHPGSALMACWGNVSLDAAVGD